MFQICWVLCNIIAIAVIAGVYFAVKWLGILVAIVLNML